MIDQGAGTAQPTKQEKTQRQLHQVGDIMRKVNGFAFLACLCGLNLKIPPNFKADTVRCPRCRRTLDIAAQRRAAQAASGGSNR